MRQLRRRSWIYNHKNIGQIILYVLCFLTVWGSYWLTDKGQELWSFAVLLNWQICSSPQTYSTSSSAAKDSFMDQLTTYFTFLIGLLYDFLFNFLNFSPNAFFMLRFWIFRYRREGAYLLKNLVRIQVLVDNIKPAHICKHAQTSLLSGPCVLFMHVTRACVREGIHEYRMYEWRFKLRHTCMSVSER